MKKIYAVTSGTYSDYRIDAMFSSKENAQNFIDAFEKRYDEFRIEEYELDAVVPTNKKAYFVRMDKLGNVKEIYISDSAYSFSKNANISFTFDNTIMNCYVFAKDENHAIKIANEKRVFILAENKWGIS
jgi:hypothetical protein